MTREELERWMGRQVMLLEDYGRIPAGSIGRLSGVTTGAGWGIVSFFEDEGHDVVTVAVHGYDVARHLRERAKVQNLTPQPGDPEWGQ